jgi:hypothetical protein
MESFICPYEFALLQQRNDSIQLNYYLFTYKLESPEANYKVSTSKKEGRAIPVTGRGGP